MSNLLTPLLLGAVPVSSNRVTINTPGSTTEWGCDNLHGHNFPDIHKGSMAGINSFQSKEGIRTPIGRVEVNIVPDILKK